jgi:hypothetical protein
MALHLIVGFATEADAAAASRRLYNLSRPTVDPTHTEADTQFALGWRQHPTEAEWALDLRDDYSLPVSPILQADPELADPGVLVGLMTDPAATLAAVVGMERVSAAFILSAIKPALVLSPGDAGYDAWFAAGE